MSTSNSYSYTETAQTLIYDALDFLGCFDDTPPTPSEYNRALRQLNRILKSVQVENTQDVGMHVWQRQVGFLFLSSTTGQYVLSADSPWWCNAFSTTSPAGINSQDSTTLILANVALINTSTPLGLQLDSGVMQWVNVISVDAFANTVAIDAGLNYSMSSTADVVYIITDDSAQPPQVVDFVNIRNSQGNDLKVDTLTYEQYNALPGKKQPGFTGDPQAVYYESHLVGNSGQGFGYLSTDVNGASDLTKYLVINYAREIQDVINPTDEIDAPKEFFNAVMYSLSRQLAPSFEVNWTQNMENLYIEAVKLAGNANPKRSTAKFTRTRHSSVWRNPPHR